VVCLVLHNALAQAVFLLVEAVVSRDYTFFIYFTASDLRRFCFPSSNGLVKTYKCLL